VAALQKARQGKATYASLTGKRCLALSCNGDPKQRIAREAVAYDWTKNIDC
jgi:hypothetical protein